MCLAWKESTVHNTTMVGSNSLLESAEYKRSGQVPQTSVAALVGGSSRRCHASSDGSERAGGST